MAKNVGLVDWLVLHAGDRIQLMTGPALVVQLDGCQTGDRRLQVWPLRVRNILSWRLITKYFLEIDHEIQYKFREGYIVRAPR